MKRWKTRLLMLFLAFLLAAPASAGIRERMKAKNWPVRGHAAFIGEGCISYIDPMGKPISKTATSDVIDFILRRDRWRGDEFGFKIDPLTGQIVRAKHLKSGELASSSTQPCRSPLDVTSGKVAVPFEIPNDIAAIVLPDSARGMLSWSVIRNRAKCPDNGRTCVLLTELRSISFGLDDKLTANVEELSQRYCED